MNLFVLILFVCCFRMCRNGVTGARWNVSQEDELKIERQLKLLNKPAIKTIKTEYGDLYDCVDFFIQPAFDHPLLKNHTTDFQVIPPSIIKIIRSHHSKKVKEVDNIGIKGLECPSGTVPIRRVTKEELMEEHLSSKGSSPENGQTHFAVVNSIGTKRYSGAGAFISIHNPKVNRAQYSSARLRVTNGQDGIQVGWRVDPSLYHDTKTRLFVRTDAGQTHCFNTRCPGFVVVRRDFPPDTILHNISVFKGPRYSLKMFIIRDAHGNWELQAGATNIVIGYWPARLFTRLSNLASFLEWGGEVYSPPGTPFPPMGEGDDILFEDTYYDAYLKQVSAYDELGQLTDANDIKVNGDSLLYHVIDEGVTDKYDFKHWVVYGGAGGIERKM